jgi:iron-sulfur cluster assembly accessory protein
MINLTPKAIEKVKEVMAAQNPQPVALRVGVRGGGCSGFQYALEFAAATNDTDEVLDFDGLKVAVDQMSAMYLEGIVIDYLETLEASGFKFDNPNVKRTCGCGSSFSV